MKSKSPVAALVARLKLQGYLESTPEKRLKPGKRFFERPIFDSVRAGFPSPAEDENHDTLTIDEFLVSHPSSTVLVNVKGDSMIDAGILPGDTVIVEKRAVANVGDMVIAIIDNRQALLNKFGIRTAADFVDTPEREIRRLLGKAGTDLWHELNGTPIYKVETEAKLPKSVARTASLGEITQDKQTIRAHLLKHAMRLSKELITKRLTVRQLTVFLTLKSFDKQATTSELPYPSADYFLLASEAGRALDTLYDPGQFYRACGLIADDIAIRQSGSFDLFQMAEQQREEKHLKLLETMHTINHKHGDNVIAICGAMQKRKAEGVMGRFAYPVLECS